MLEETRALRSFVKTWKRPLEHFIRFNFGGHSLGSFHSPSGTRLCSLTCFTPTSAHGVSEERVDAQQRLQIVPPPPPGIITCERTRSGTRSEEMGQENQEFGDPTDTIEDARRASNTSAPNTYQLKTAELATSETPNFETSALQKLTSRDRIASGFYSTASRHARQALSVDYVSCIMACCGISSLQWFGTSWFYTVVGLKTQSQTKQHHTDSHDNRNLSKLVLFQYSLGPAVGGCLRILAVIKYVLARARDSQSLQGIAKLSTQADKQTQMEATQVDQGAPGTSTGFYRCDTVNGSGLLILTRPSNGQIFPQDLENKYSRNRKNNDYVLDGQRAATNSDYCWSGQLHDTS
uniref:Uncharacterized protein n=1 Tax=Timema shepardi TaxID=629360 RepID=A0A7R9AY00_TIMSH|nr:unnamed protein product [Timema shepardi]